LCSNGDEKYFIIFDYKTGKYIPGLKQITEGTSLQLPVYIACVNKLLSDKFGAPANSAGGIYYLLGDSISLNPGIGDKEYYAGPKSAKLMDEFKYQAIIEKSVVFVEEYVQGISSGKFGFPKPERDLDEICKYCNFMTICRIKCIKILDNNN
jgi:ATP-dependent helicase/DNAse subunit B